MSGYRNYVSKTYLAEHHVREKHILTLIHKYTKYPCFLFKDENGTEYYHEANYLPIETEQGWINAPITKFGKWAESSDIGESVCASFYIGKVPRENSIFDVRMSKKEMRKDNGGH